MGAKRSASVAIAALIAGCACLGAPAAAAQADVIVQTNAIDPIKPDVATPPPASVAPKADDAARPSPAPAAEAPADKIPATEAPAAAAPAPPPAPADPLAAAVAARLADPAPLLARLTTKDREAIQAFYALGAFKPLWIADGALTPAARSVTARLAAAAEDGLDPVAYPVPILGRDKPSEAEIAQADLKLSAAAALYARDARGGRINPGGLSRLITPTLDLPAADVTLGRIAGAGAEAGAILQRFNPGQPGYLALKARLATLRGERSAPVAARVTLPPGPTLRPGMRDARVPLLRERFGLESRTAGTLDSAPGEPDSYDQGVASAVSAFQRARGLPATGILTPQTIAALASPESGPRHGEGEGALLVNMERWRWLPADLGRDHVIVNIPEFRLRVFKGGHETAGARVIVGKAETPTPIFSGMMEYAVVNPSWNVPPSILKNEFLPGLARDPSYAARRGYEVVYRNGNVSVRQPPGERNALGFIKFMFPNDHAVYLHDTPNRSLFSASQRALSHGCVRVDDPFRFADSVLPDTWSSERLKKLIGKGERTIRLAEKLPVHLAYFTAVVDDLGAYRTLPDLYGYDARMKHALGLPGGVAPAVAKAAPKPAAPPNRSPARIARSSDDSAAIRPARASAERVPRVFGDPDVWAPAAPPRARGWW